MEEYEILLDALHARVRKSHHVSLKQSIPHPFATNAPLHLLDAPKVLMFKPKTGAGHRCVYDPCSQSWLDITGPTPVRLKTKHCPTFVNSTPQSSIHLHRACQKSRAVARLVKKYKFPTAHETPVFLLHKWMRGTGDIRYVLHLKLLHGVVHDAVKHVLPEIRQIVADNPTLYEPEEVTQAILGESEADPVGVLSYVVSFAQLERLGIDFVTDEFLVRRPPKRACKKIQAQLAFFHNKHMRIGEDIGDFIGVGMTEAGQNKIFFVDAVTHYVAHYSIYKEMAQLSADIQRGLHAALHDIDVELTRVWMAFVNPKTSFPPSTFNTFSTHIPNIASLTLANRTVRSIYGFENPLSFHEIVGLRFFAWSSPENFEIATRYVNIRRKAAYKKYSPGDAAPGGTLVFAPDTPEVFKQRVLSRLHEWPEDMLKTRIDILAEPIPTKFVELKQVVLAYFNIEAWSRLMGTTDGQAIFTPDQRKLIGEVLADMLSTDPAENARGYVRLLGKTPFILTLKGRAGLFKPLPEKPILYTLFRSLK